MDLIIAAFPWGSYLGEEALENGVDAMISSWNRAAQTPSQRQQKRVVTTYLLSTDLVVKHVVMVTMKVCRSQC
ncbi:hypothetical protein OK016_09045 [Vibrio chagasii]|nr:hypothetical protein [Vibrio chagasii]